jgi:RND family efflux transporter MFP subunit
MKKVLSNFLKRRAPLYFIIAIVLVIIVYLFIYKNSNSTFETENSEISSITEQISVTGKVTALKTAELAFEKGGVVKKINHKVGDPVKALDVIIELDSSDSNAQLLGAEANLLAERAKLIELEQGLRPEELSVEEAKLKSAQISFEDARTTVINALHDSYIKTENSVFNYSDSFFVNPQSVVPRIDIRTENYAQENSINMSRVVVGEKLKMWKSDLDKMTIQTDPTKFLENVHDYLEKTKLFMSQLSSIVSNLTPGISGLSQATIDSHNVTINLAVSTFNTAVASMATAESVYRSALSNLALIKDQFELRKVGSSEQTIQAQKARVDQANSSVLLYKSELIKKTLISPIDGIITKVENEVGEFVSPGQISAVVMSDVLKVEVNIPESDIAKVSVGNTANITLDAYDDSNIFPAHIIMIDPAETIVEGVPTYKVTLQFDQKDERIRSGMTANINVTTRIKENVVTVPYRAVYTKDGISYVKVVNDSNAKDFSELKIVTGIRGNDGRIEIISGLGSGLKVITFIK